MTKQEQAVLRTAVAAYRYYLKKWNHETGEEAIKAIKGSLLRQPPAKHFKAVHAYVKARAAENGDGCR